MIGQRIKTENSFKQIVTKIEELVDTFWTYIMMAGAAVVVVWGAVIGIRIAVARRKEEQINARGMVKSLIIGIIVVFVIAVAAPMLIKGLSSWIAW
jgi:succinate dehydrogenase/fumarate reductase cytochrome b subunit